MSKFSTIACYAALTSCSRTDVMKAYARMVAALIQQKKYDFCNVKQLSHDFNDYYGFSLPYHPMKTIVNECVNLGFLSYDSSLYQYVPNYKMINDESFLEIVKNKDAEYDALIKKFGQFLQSKHNIYSSPEDLNERVLAFVEKYGVKTFVNKSVLKQAKEDYYFAEFLIFCEERGFPEVLDYLNEFTIGLALSEVFTYSENPTEYTSQKTTVYLDTSILFILLGIDSWGRTDSYKEFIFNMRRLGMKIKVYSHSVNELLGIVNNSKRWIGNYEYDYLKASETTYFFVTNNWSIEDVELFEDTIYDKISELQIEIEKMDYPQVEHIVTTSEATIKDMIIDAYRSVDASFDAESKEQSVDYDARSIFYTQHKSGTIVPAHINEVQHIFVTQNRSLARVGHKISKEAAQYKDVFIPVVLTDVIWGTLIWFQSPATISVINRPKLVSAAYAAFQPSNEITKKMNEELSRLVAEDRIAPKQCYLLKVSPVSRKLLASKTHNDPERFTPETPLEILREIERDAFKKGEASRQNEVDEFKLRLWTAERQLKVEAANRTLEVLDVKIDSKKTELSRLEREQIRIGDDLDSLLDMKTKALNATDTKIKWIKLLMTFILAGIAFVSLKVVTSYDWVPQLFSIIVWFTLFAINLWYGDKLNTIKVLEQLRMTTLEKECEQRNYSVAKELRLINEKATLQEAENKIKDELFALEMEYIEGMHALEDLTDSDVKELIPV